ncbi:hypothetical protein LS684_03140 [Cytobacillus spongiae]|jgi:hypothetical protein|uniref:hypothetical protein n=1 Tax=Cytobacillus spongiae TaxID=2901381 RepID=UPI001F26A463|nr:hypothetical protein [Cytobacillus spongiae]UII56495.1 hypothetical protein LS684_03140 [Cytobacillus spongiae]
MKNYIYIIALLSMMAFVSACSHETEGARNEQTMDDVVTSDQNELKETKDTAWLKEKSIYQYKGRQGSTEFEVYVYAQNATTSVLKKSTVSGDKGDTIIEGKLAVYLAEKGASLAYKQTIQDINKKMVINISKDNPRVLTIGESHVLTILETEERYKSKSILLTYHKGEIKRIGEKSKDVIVTGHTIKKISTNLIQTANIEQGLIFQTWRIDPKTLEIQLVDETSYADAELGRQLYNEWEDTQSLYHPFLNLSLNEQILQMARQGLLMGTQYPIGANVEEIKRKNVGYLVDEGEYLQHPEVTYYLSPDSSKVTGVMIPGERLKTTVHEVKRLLGQPSTSLIEQQGNEMSMVYPAEEYQLIFTSDSAGVVKQVLLNKAGGK